MRYRPSLPSATVRQAFWMALLVLLIAGAAFLAGWLVALGAVHQALATLHRDIIAVNRRRPLRVTRINFGAGILGFFLGMLVVVVGRRILKPVRDDSEIMPSGSGADRGTEASATPAPPPDDAAW